MSVGLEYSDDVVMTYIVSKQTHPKISVMVNDALDELKDRKGSSLQAIKKFVMCKYGYDVEKQALHIKKYLKAAVAEGTIVQMSGKGASGSFKLQKTGVRSGGKPVAIISPRKVTASKQPKRETTTDVARHITSTPIPSMKVKKQLHDVRTTKTRSKKTDGTSSLKTGKSKANLAEKNTPKEKVKTDGSGKVRTKPSVEKTKAKANDQIAKTSEEPKQPKFKVPSKTKAVPKSKVSSGASKGPEKQPKATKKVTKNEAKPKASKQF